MEEISKRILREIYKMRPAVAKKYDYGLLLVIGGSEFYTGSGAFAAMAAYRVGVDMVHILAPKRAADIIAGFSPNIAALPLKGDWLDEEDLATLMERTHAAKVVSYGKTAVVIGGGLGRSKETQETILKYLEQIDLDIPVVVDADAIHALALNPEVVRGKKFLITPHAYEFYVLTGKKLTNLEDEGRGNLVKSEAQRLGLTMLVKGAQDIIVVSDGERIARNETGSPSMSVGGTGDSLAGIAGALLARGVSLYKAACAAAYINGKAGELAARRFRDSMLTTDLIEEIPNVLFKRSRIF